MRIILCCLMMLWGWIGCGDGDATEVFLKNDHTSPKNTDPEIETDTEPAGPTHFDTDERPATDLCGEQDVLDVLDGEYRANNNIWNDGDGVGDQCITVRENSFEVTLSEHNFNQVAAYPFFLKGCHLGGECTEDSGMPIKISDINTCTFTWEIDVMEANGTFNAAFEAWFTDENAGFASGELMIWINRWGTEAVPSGDYQETVEIEGHSWRVNTGKVAFWNYIAYVIEEPITYADFDFTAFVDDAIARGSLEPDWTMDAMEAGFEIWRGSQHLRTISFEAHVD